MRLMTASKTLATAALALALTACAGSTRVHQSTALQADAPWAIAPLANHSETPLAGEKARGMLVTSLAREGIASPRLVPRKTPVNPLAINDDVDQQEALSWAQQHGVRYLVTGAVEEWHYKAGLDGEPAVGMTLQVVDVSSGDLLWSGSGARGGWGFSTLSGEANDLLDDLVDDIDLAQ